MEERLNINVKEFFFYNPIIKLSETINTEQWNIPKINNQVAQTESSLLNTN